VSAVPPIFRFRSLPLRCAPGFSEILCEVTRYINSDLRLPIHQAARQDYDAALQKLRSRLPEPPGRADADHGWLTPVKAQSDIVAVDALIEQGIVGQGVRRRCTGEMPGGVLPPQKEIRAASDRNKRRLILQRWGLGLLLVSFVLAGISVWLGA
jgi:hypothetical protein